MPLAIASQKVRMRGAKDDVNGVRVSLGDFRHRADRVFDALARREKAECQQSGAAGNAKSILVEIWVHERRVRDSMRDDGDFLRSHAVDVAKHLRATLCHDHEFAGIFNDASESQALRGVGVGQHRVQGCHGGHPRAAEEFGNMRTRRTSENSKLVLHAQHIGVREVQEISRAKVGAAIVLGDFEANLGGVFVRCFGLGDGDDRAIPIRPQRRHSLPQVAGESGNATLPRGVIPEDSNFSGRAVGIHNLESASNRSRPAVEWGDHPVASANGKISLPNFGDTSDKPGG